MDTALNPFEALPGKPPRDADKKLRMVSNVIALFWLIASILMLLDIPEYLVELRVTVHGVAIGHNIPYNVSGLA